MSKSKPTPPESVEPYVRSIVQVTLSQRLRDILDGEASKNGQSMAEYCRTVLAEHVGYDLVAEQSTKVDKRGRKPVYSSPEARRLANNARQRKNYQTTRDLVAEFKHRLALRDHDNLRASLEARGVDVSDIE